MNDLDIRFYLIKTPVEWQDLEFWGEWRNPHYYDKDRQLWVFILPSGKESVFTDSALTYRMYNFDKTPEEIARVINQVQDIDIQVIKDWIAEWENKKLDPQ
jgi:hypothetical protein